LREKKEGLDLVDKRKITKWEEQKEKEDGGKKAQCRLSRPG